SSDVCSSDLHHIQQRLQIAGLVIQGQGTVGGHLQKAAHLALVGAEQLGDDRLLVAVVVVEVARGDAEVRGNVVGGDAAFALGIEQLQTGLNDTFAGTE